MEKIKSFIQNHKRECLLGGVVFIMLILVLLIFIIVPPISDNNYGDRLKGESKYKITNNKVNEIKNTISKEDGVDKVDYHKEGKVLNFTIKLEEGVVLDTGKKYADELISKLDKKNLKFYDIQIFLDGKDDVYPIIGYHSKGSESIIWGNVGEG